MNRFNWEFGDFSGVVVLAGWEVIKTLTFLFDFIWSLRKIKDTRGKVTSKSFLYHCPDLDDLIGRKIL